MLFMIIPFAWVKGSNRVLKRFTAHQSTRYRTWPGRSVRQRAYGRIALDDEGQTANFGHDKCPERGCCVRQCRNGSYR